MGYTPYMMFGSELTEKQFEKAVAELRKRTRVPVYPYKFIGVTKPEGRAIMVTRPMKKKDLDKLRAEWKKIVAAFMKR